jgi:lipopolysaccharide export system protein LptA
VGESTSDLVANVADVVGNFKLTKLPVALTVRSNKMEFDLKKGRLAYDGDVEIKHGDVTLNANSLLLTFTPGKPDDLREVRADGGVEVVRGHEVARGRSAVYNPTEATLKLVGDASLGSGPNLVEGESVIIYLDEGRAIVERGDEPVRAIIEPGSLDDEELLN